MLDVTYTPLNALRFNTRLSLQETGTNLDSSEDFLLGDPVRAYPLGEAPGDRGYLVQVQLKDKPNLESRIYFMTSGV